MIVSVQTIHVCAFNYFCLSLFIIIISRLFLFDIVPILALMLFMFLVWCCSYLICSCSNLSHCFGSTLHFDPTSWAFLVLMMFLLLHFFLSQELFLFTCKVQIQVPFLLLLLLHSYSNIIHVHGWYFPSLFFLSIGPKI